MSSLTPVEKRVFEELLGMSSGYVFDFTDRTFASFFRDVANIDIDNDMYCREGNSKARRMRLFWEIEPDAVVGVVLSEILKLRALALKDTERILLTACQTAADRLLGRKSTPVQAVQSEAEFLQLDFGAASVAALPIEASWIPILEHRLAEAERCVRVEAWLSVVILCGSVLEAALLGTALQHPRDFNESTLSPKDRSGKVLPLHDWKLAHLVDVAHDCRHLKVDVRKFSHTLREFRNYVHPLLQLTSGFSPDKHTALICMQVLKAAIADLAGERA